MVRRLLLAGAALTATLALASPTGAHPPDDGRLAFSSDLEGLPQVFSARVDGSDVRNLTRSPAASFRPAYSPDGRYVAFADTRHGGSEIYVMRADGTGQRRITFSEGAADLDPSWSPNGRRLVFYSLALPAGPDEPFGNGDVFVVDVRGGAPRNVTRSPDVHDIEPVWSPVGRRIAFASNAAGLDNFDVYTIRPRGRDMQRLTDAPGWDSAPDFSPDGRRIAFESERATATAPDVFVMAASGDDERPLELTPGRETFPSFSPDGQSIAFASPRDGASSCVDGDQPCDDVFVQRLAPGAQAVNVTNTRDVTETHPDWQPPRRWWWPAGR